MKIILINKSDATGGAAVVTFRLMEALRALGVDARMLVAERLTDSPYVAMAAPEWRIKEAFMAERLDIYRRRGVTRANLFKIDTARCGLPLHRHEWVRNADAVFLGWVNQGMLSLSEIARIAALGKPLVWTMHDMWCATGICHHSGVCRRYQQQCGNCPLLGRGASASDLSAQTYRRKVRELRPINIKYVAVSHWLAQKAASSSLLRNADVNVIPNPFELPAPLPDTRGDHPDTVRIVMGAARLDDPIKGLPVLVEATRLLAARVDAPRFELVTFGALRDPHVLDAVAIPWRHLGTISGSEALARVYSDAHIVVSSSSYETLPGTLVEGQAFGCVPVAFDSGGQRDIIDDGVTGFLAQYSPDTATAAANLADAMVRASAKTDSATRVIMRRSVEQRFSARSVAEAYMSLIGQKN